MKKNNPVTPTLRFKTVADFSRLSKEGPHKALTLSKKRKSGRNCYGRITVRRLGGGHKRRLRIVDFQHEKLGVTAIIERFEYDPNRSGRLSLALYADGERRYVLASEGFKVGESIVAGENVKIKSGNSLPLGNIPVGTEIHSIEIKPGLGAKLARSAGAYATVMAHDDKLTIVRLPSKEVRFIPAACYATVGHVGNTEHSQIVLGKAGRSRWLGRRPKVRGVAQNPVDHPMGGGEGKTSGGGHPESPWGKKAKGKKTRKVKLLSNKMILARRREKYA
jgi:large subunit ribosomal protein L2